MTKAQRVLVTGASGFIGRHLVRRLREDGHHVHGLGRGEPNEDCHEWTRASLADRDLLAAAARDIDAIIHLACTPVADAQLDPAGSFVTNTEGTMHIMDVARVHDTGRVLVASSAQVYGRPDQIPVPETAPLEPIGPYGATKAAAEVLVSAYAASAGISTILPRIFNAYGPPLIGAFPPNAVTRFLTTAIAGQPPVVTAHPESSRDLIHVEDVAKGLTSALQADVTGPLNLGTGRETTLPDLADLVLALTGTKGTSQLAPQEAQRARLVADTTRATEALAFTPTITPEQGISDLVLRAANTPIPPWSAPHT